MLLLVNGAYGERMAQICDVYGIRKEVLRYSDREAVSASDLAAKLRELKHEKGVAVSHVAVVHHETTGGVLNPLDAVCAELDTFNAELETGKDKVELIVDSMSAFGAYDVDMAPGGRHAAVSYLVSSSNKNLQGVPGFAFCVYQKAALAQLDKRRTVEKSVPQRSVALDLLAQAKGLTTGSGQFRFTPPTHTILAFRRALEEHEAEGGVAARHSRYMANYAQLVKGLCGDGGHASKIN